MSKDLTYKNCRTFKEIKAFAEQKTSEMHYCYVRGYLNDSGKLYYRANDFIAEVCLFSNNIEDFKSNYLDDLSQIENVYTRLYNLMKSAWDKIFKDFIEYNNEIEEDEEVVTSDDMEI